MQINLNEIKISPIIDSVYREKISDKEYFSEKYKDYISNSRLGLINPEQGGNPDKCWLGFNEDKTASLNLGSFIHCLVLQPDEFYLVKDLHMRCLLKRFFDLNCTIYPKWHKFHH